MVSYLDILAEPMLLAGKETRFREGICLSEGDRALMGASAFMVVT
jgi:hypothetical protein